MTEERLIPISSTWLQTTFYLLLLVWAIYLLLQARNWSSQDQLFPTLLGVLIVILIPLQLLKMHVRSVREFLESEEESSSVASAGRKTDRSNREQEIHALIVIGWTTFLFLISYIIGFVYSIPLFVFLFVTYYLRDLKIAAVTSFVFSLCLYLLFVEVLNLRMWQGILALPSPL